MCQGLDFRALSFRFQGFRVSALRVQDVFRVNVVAPMGYMVRTLC